ncbi:MAG: hypothetical protein EBR82_81080, partial [Caulobacteraceae bacterium]|nr:hypothetical protein [Caulobacteraceae bacterium]
MPYASFPASSVVHTGVLVAFQIARLVIDPMKIVDALASVAVADIECEAYFLKLPFLVLFEYKFQHSFY